MPRSFSLWSHVKKHFCRCAHLIAFTYHHTTHQHKIANETSAQIHRKNCSSCLSALAVFFFSISIKLNVHNISHKTIVPNRWLFSYKIQRNNLFYQLLSLRNTKKKRQALVIYFMSRVYYQPSVVILSLCYHIDWETTVHGLGALSILWLWVFDWLIHLIGFCSVEFSNRPVVYSAPRKQHINAYFNSIRIWFESCLSRISIRYIF